MPRELVPVLIVEQSKKRYGNSCNKRTAEASHSPHQPQRTYPGANPSYGAGPMQYRLFPKSREQRHKQREVRGARIIDREEMVIETSSGNHYCYDIKSNKIDVYNEGDVPPVMSPIVFGDVEKVESFPNIDTFILELTQNCNFRCSYCCYGGNYEGNRTHSSKVMSEETLNKVISFIAKHRVPERKVNIVFYGGEPTLYPDKIKYFVEQVKGILPQDTEYTISTNGSRLMDDNFLGWCVEHDFTLNISYDGTSQSELKRIYKNGCDTQKDVLNVLEQIKTDYPEYWDSKVNILVTLPDIHNLRPISIEWSRSWVLRSKAPYLISGVSPCKLSDYAVDEEDTISVMRDLKDFYAHNQDNLFVKTYFSLLSTPTLDRPIFPLPDNHSPLMCLPFNNRCYIDAYGNLGICEKTSDKLRLGNVYDGWDFDKVNEAMTKMATLRKNRCRHCESFRFCKTCFTNYYFNDEWWKADCDWQRTWTRIAMTISLELLEQDLIAYDDAIECNLREIQQADIPDIYRIMSDPATMKYLDGVEIFKDSEDSLRFYLLMSEINAKFACPLLFAITNRDDRMIGIVGIDEIHGDAGNLFFLLERQSWRKGIMTAMLAEYLGKRVPKYVKRITTHINPQNEAALALMSKFETIKVSTSPYI